MFGFRFPPYKDNYKKYINMLSQPLPPRPTKRTATDTSTKTATGAAVTTGWISLFVSLLVSVASFFLARNSEGVRKLRS